MTRIEFREIMNGVEVIGGAKGAEVAVMPNPEVIAEISPDGKVVTFNSAVRGEAEAKAKAKAVEKK